MARNKISMDGGRTTDLRQLTLYKEPWNGKFGLFLIWLLVRSGSIVLIKSGLDWFFDVRFSDVRFS